MIGLDGYDEEAELQARRLLMPRIFGVLKVCTFELQKRGLGLTRDPTLVTGVTGLNMNLTDDLLSIDLTIQTDYSEGAGTRTVTRDTVIVHRFGT